jgi:hypothetical protein
MKALAQHIFQPIREHFGKPIHVSSGYRSKDLNKAIGGSQTSQHSKGQAMDIDMDGSDISNRDIFMFIKDNLEFDQIINEFNYAWVHVGYRQGANRKQVLKAVKEKGKTVYQVIK